MARLTEEMVIARSKQSDLTAIKKLNCWGAELGDVSLLRRMPNVEVLALSINKIRTLVDFAGCRRLRELYVRKNEIGHLSEIRHLRRLPDLTSLWLDENPCTQHPEYRMTVLRNLPHLEKLDNVPVNPDEVQEAMRRGEHIPDSDDEGYPQQQESYGQYRRQQSCESSPEREPEPYYSRAPPPARHEQAGSDSSEAGAEPAHDSARSEPQCPVSPTRRAGAALSPDADERYDHPAMTRSHYDPARAARSPDAPALRHSLSAHSVKPARAARSPDAPALRHSLSAHSVKPARAARSPDAPALRHSLSAHSVKPARAARSPDAPALRHSLSAHSVKPARAARSPDAPALRHSLSAHSVKEYSYNSNGECRFAPGGGVASPPHYHDNYYERPDRSESYGQMSSRCGGDAWEAGGAGAGAAAGGAGAGGSRERVTAAGAAHERDYPSAVMAEHRGFTRRPVARNSNLLSAVLCLVKELDYPSLEVAEMAVRCRMDELANSQ